MQQGEVVLGLLTPADQDAAEAVHPAVRPLHHPPPRLVAGPALHPLRLLLLGRDVRREAELLRDLLHLIVGVAPVQAEALRRLRGRVGPLDGDTFQRLPDHLHVGEIGAVDGQADRDAVRLDQQAALGPELGAVGRVFAGLFPPPAGPWSCTRPCSARTSRSPSSRRRPSARPPTWPGRRPPLPSAGSGRGRWSRGRSGWRPAPSTGSRCAGGRGWPPCRRGRGWAACRRRRGGCSSAAGSAAGSPPTGRRGCPTGLARRDAPCRTLHEAEKARGSPCRSYSPWGVIRIGP